MLRLRFLDPSDRLFGDTPGSYGISISGALYAIRSFFWAVPAIEEVAHHVCPHLRLLGQPRTDCGTLPF